MRTDRANEIALQAIDWLIANPEALAGFMAEAGLDAADMRRLLANPDLPAAALEHVLATDQSVLAFAAAAGLRPEEPGIARQALAGAGGAHWT